MITDFGLFLGETSHRFLLFMTKEIIFAAVLFIPVFLLAVLLRKKSPVWELGLLTLVLIRLVLPPGFAIPGLKFNGLKNIQSIKKINNIIPDFKIKEKQKYSLSDPAVLLNQEQESTPQEKSAANKTSISPSLPLWQTAIFGVWLFGFLLTLTIHVKRYLYFRRIVSNAAELDDRQVHAVLTHWQKAFRVKRKIRAVFSDQCLSPFTIGIFRPVIYIPQVMLESKNPDLLNSVFAHEMAHIKFFDDLWIKFQNLIQSIYFFYPVVWYVNSRIFLVRECLRDSLVLSKGNIPPKALGQGILFLAKMNLVGSDYFLYLPGFGNAKRKVSFRIRNLEAVPVSLSKRILIYVLLMFFGILIFSLSASVNSANSPGNSIETLVFSSMPSMRGVNTLNGNQMLEPRGVGSSESPEDFFEPLYPESTSLDAHLFLPAVRLFEDIVKEPKAAADSEMRKAEGQFDKIVDSILGNSFRNDSLPPLRLDEQYTPPRLIKRVKPDYPVEARLRRIEGTVILEATTDEHGIVKDIKVQRSIPALNQAAVEAVRQWIYEPMIINGRPRKVIFRVTVNFELTKPDKF